MSDDTDAIARAEGPTIHHHPSPSRRNTLVVAALTAPLSRILLRAGLSVFRTSASTPPVRPASGGCCRSSKSKNRSASL